MRFLRSNTAVIITVGPFYDKTDGVVIETALTITNEKITLTADTDGGSAPTNILDNVTGATSGTANDLNYITGNDAGMMQMELAAADVNRVGRMFLSITDAANHVPVFHEFFVLPAAIYDWLTGVIVPLPANVTTWNGTAVSSPATAGIPEVNVKNVNNVAASSVTTVNANLGTTQPVNFTGTGASALAKSDMVDVAGAAVSTSTAQIGVNAVNAGGTAWASGAITAASIAADAITAAKVADGTIDAATFAASAINAAAIAADAITAAKIADGAIDAATFAAGAINAAAIAADAITAAKIADGAIDAATFAAAAITATAIAADAITDAKVAADVTIASVTGAVGSVTGAVGSVTGNVGGNVTGSVASVTAGVTLADDAITAGKFDETTAFPLKSADTGATQVARTGADADTLETLSDQLDATASQASVDTIDGIVDGIAVQTSRVDALIEDSTGDRFTAKALEEAPTGGSAPTAAAIADAVWEEAIADHSGTAGSTAEALGAAGSAGDPWTTALPGAYSAGQAGKIVGDNLNATVSSRATQASVDTIDDFVDTEVAAIKAKTDQLTFTTANKVDSTIQAAADLAQAAADKVWSTATRVLTAGTNIALAKGTGVTGFNDLSAAQVNAEADTALADYDGPTHAELTAELATADDAVLAAIAALNNLSSAQVNAEVVDALATDTYAEPSAVLSATASLSDKINWLAALARNRILQTATVQTLRNDANSADIATAAVSDDGTTFERSEWA